MVVGNTLSKSAAASVPSQFTASEGAVGYSSPAAETDSMFCSEPTTLKSLIGTMTPMKARKCPAPKASTRSPMTGTGR